MKILKYIAVALVVAALVAIAAHLYRDSIVRTFANRVLEDQNIVVTELAIDSLKTDYVYLSYLELEQDDGSRYMISGLSFPLDFPNVDTAEITIEEMQAVPAESASAGTAATSPVAALQAFLDLPNNMPRTGVSLLSFEMTGMPEVRNVEWQSEPGQQRLTMELAAVEVQINSANTGDNAYVASVSAGPPDIPDALILDLSIEQNEAGFSIDGSAAISLSPWLPILRDFALLPVEILSVAADLSGPLQLEIGQEASASVQLSPADEILAEYDLGNDRRVAVRATTSSVARINAAYPSARWNAGIDQLRLEVNAEGIDAIPLELSNLQCLPGVSCSTNLQSSLGPTTIGTTTIDRIELSTALQIAKDEQTNIEVSSGPLLAFRGIETSGYSVAAAQASLASTASFSFAADDWQADIAELHINFDSISDSEGRTVNVPLSLTAIRLRDTGSSINSAFSVPPRTGTLSLGELQASLPGMDGDISLQGTSLRARGSLSDGPGATSGSLVLTHSLDDGSGELQLEDIRLDFAAAELSSLFTAWPNSWDLVSGTVTTNADFAWVEGEGRLELGGTLRSSAQALTGNYGDIAFAGLATELNATIDATNDITIAPSSMQMSLVDIGVPVRQIAADYSLDLVQEIIEVRNATMSLLGGKLHADPFRLGTDDSQYNIVLRPDAIQLQFMVDLAEFRNIELSGSISGAIPVTIEGETITVTDGRLENDPPGGVIRYLPGLEAGDSTLDLVSRALANFQFDSLTSTVNYTRNGDLKQQMRLTGMNPDMDDRQPVILNLNVENNIPSMLRSLQATRSIEEILEQRTGR